jgi:hypothetical protein
LEAQQEEEAVQAGKAAAEAKTMVVAEAEKVVTAYEEEG